MRLAQFYRAGGSLFGANGNAVRGGQLYFTNSGAARKDYNALLKMRIMKIVSSIRELLISVHTD